MHTLAENRRARLDYEIQDAFESGIELLGLEVKSVRAGRMQLQGSYVKIRDNEAWLVNAEISPYQSRNTPPDYDPKRTRRLLLHHKETARLVGKLYEKGRLLIPLRAYLKRNLIKLELGLGRSRKKIDKREILKKRAALRDIRR